MSRDKIREIFTTVDVLTTSLHSTVDAATDVAKTLLTHWLESLETKASNQNESTIFPNNNALMTADEIAEYLRVKRETIYAWVSDKKIPHLKPNGELRFRRSEIDDWMKTNAETIQTGREKSRQPVVHSRRSFPAANR